MSVFTLDRAKNGLFILTFYEDDYQVWQKYFIEVENALNYFVKHSHLSSTMKIIGEIYL